MIYSSGFLKKLLLLFMLAAVLEACNSNTSQNLPTTTSEPPFPSTMPATPTLAPAAQPIEGWLTYKSSAFHYELDYPPEAVLTTLGVTGYPTDELPPNSTPEEYLTQLSQIYPGDLCVDIQYRSGFINILAPADKGGKYAGCGVTGIGVVDVIEKTETVMIGDQSYIVTGYELHQRDAQATLASEYFRAQLADGTQITYGGNWIAYGETYEDYAPIKDLLLQILATYRSY